MGVNGCEWVNGKLYWEELWVVVKTGKAEYEYRSFTLNSQDTPVWVSGVQELKQVYYLIDIISLRSRSLLLCLLCWGFGPVYVFAIANPTQQEQGRQPAALWHVGFIGHLWYVTVHRRETAPDERGLSGGFFLPMQNSKRIHFGQTVGGGGWVWMSSIMCRGKSFLLSLQTPSSLLAALLSVPPSGPQLKTIRICWNFLLSIPPQFEGE